MRLLSFTGDATFIKSDIWMLDFQLSTDALLSFYLVFLFLSCFRVFF